MSKCRYNLEKNCSNKDCVNCVLEDIKAEMQMLHEEEVEYPHGMIQDAYMKEDVLNILNKHISGKESTLEHD